MMKVIEKICKKQENINQNKPVTIAFLGDSVTQGCFECYVPAGTKRVETIFDYSSAYSTRLKELLQLLYPTVQINIINSGISGDNATNGFDRLERDILAYNPDLLVVSFGLNDSTRGEEGLPLYTESLEKIFSKVKALGIECIFMTQNFMNTNTSEHLQSEFLRDLAADFSKIQNSGMLEKYYQSAKEVAKKQGVSICDCYEKWKKLYEGGVNVTELLANKLNHPIRELHYLFAYSLLEVMFGM